MTSIQFYRFLAGNRIEHRKISEENLIFLDFDQLKELNSMLSPCFFDDEGRKVHWQHNYVVTNANDICEYHGIDSDEIFENYS